MAFDRDQVRIYSRWGKNWSDKVPAIVPAIVDALAALPIRSATIDGEGVVVDERGLTDFERLRSALATRDGSRAVFLYALRSHRSQRRRHASASVETRRATLAGLLRKASTGIRLSEHLDGTDGAKVFQHACRMGLEGIVAKRNRPYRSGRCPDWLKIKDPSAPAALERATDGRRRADVTRD
jgi:bifunctional non-homologous end joining protein LigD